MAQADRQPRGGEEQRGGKHRGSVVGSGLVLLLLSLPVFITDLHQHSSVLVSLFCCDVLVLLALTSVSYCALNACMHACTMFCREGMPGFSLSGGLLNDDDDYKKRESMLRSAAPLFSSDTDKTGPRDALRLNGGVDGFDGW